MQRYKALSALSAHLITFQHLRLLISEREEERERERERERIIIIFRYTHEYPCSLIKRHIKNRLIVDILWNEMKKERYIDIK